MLFKSLRTYGIVFFIFFSFLFAGNLAQAQCSICTKTAQQLGEKPARGLNAGIIYLALAPFVIIGFVGYKWWKREQQIEG